MRRGLIISGFLLLAVFTLGGFWAWKTWIAPAPKISRQPVSPGPMPAMPLAMDLERYIPEGAMAVVGGRDFVKLLERFNASNLYKAYAVFAESATAEASRYYHAPDLNKPLKLDLPLLRDLLGSSFLIATYPAVHAAQPVSYAPQDFSSQDAMPRSLKPKIPPVFFAAKIPNGQSLESLLSPLISFMGPLENVEAYRGVPIVRLLSMFNACVFPAQEYFIFAASGDLEKIHSAVDLSLGDAKTASLSQAEWIRQGTQRIPSESFLYTLTKDDSLGNLNLALKDLPVFTDWSVTSLSWNAGLRSAGYSHIPTQSGGSFSGWSQTGPADYDLLQLLPANAFILVATNSLLPETAAGVIKNYMEKLKDVPASIQAFVKNNASSLAEQLDDQAAVAYNGFSKSSSGWEHDAVLAAQFKSPLRAFLTLRAAQKEFAKPESGLTFEKLESSKLNPKFSLSFKTQAGKERKIFCALRGRNFFAATRRESLENVFSSANAGVNPAAPPPGLPQKSNFIVLVDACGLYKNILTAMMEQTQKAPGGFGQAFGIEMVSLLDLFSGFKMGGTTFMNVKEGVASQSWYPYEDLSVTAWDAKLAPFKSAIANSIRGKMGTELRQRKNRPAKKRSRTSRPRRL